MKAAACFLAIILSVLMVQPAFTNFSMKAASSSCTKNKPVTSTCSKKKAKPVCSKNKCKPPKEESKGKNPCGADSCNPLLGCPSGNFYALYYSHIAINPIIVSKQKTPLFNDNRISKQLTECWHPPEII